MIKLDYKDSRSLHEQIEDGIKTLIINKVLAENEQLPSVRELSLNLTVNPNTVQKAYKQLETDGFIYSVKGKGNFVAPVSHTKDEKKIAELYETFETAVKALLYLGENEENINSVINKIKEVTKHFDSFKALDSLTLHVRKGTIYGLIGPNGAGKTTVINHINGCLKPESGVITVDNYEVYENEEIKKRILNISDEWFYYATYTVKQMARFYKDIYPAFSSERYEKLKEVFKLNEKKQIRKMSKGQKKQVAFWLSLSAMPDVLILDEPLDGLDPVMRKQVLNLVIADVADREMTVLVSSHNLRELEDICDWVGIIHQGKIIAEKPLDDLKGGVCKFQLSFKEDVGEFLNSLPGIMHISKTGAVYNIIAKGDSEEIQKALMLKEPILIERVSLTLEEVFIYELEGLGYDFKNIIF